MNSQNLKQTTLKVNFIIVLNYFYASNRLSLLIHRKLAIAIKALSQINFFVEFLQFKIFWNARTSRYAYLPKNFESQKLLRKTWFATAPLLEFVWDIKEMKCVPNSSIICLRKMILSSLKMRRRKLCKKQKNKLRNHCF